MVAYESKPKPKPESMHLNLRKRNLRTTNPQPTRIPKHGNRLNYNSNQFNTSFALLWGLLYKNCVPRTAALNTLPQSPMIENQTVCLQSILLLLLLVYVKVGEFWEKTSSSRIFSLFYLDKRTVCGCVYVWVKFISWNNHVVCLLFNGMWSQPAGLV